MKKIGLLITNVTHTNEKFMQQVDTFVQAFEAMKISLTPTTNEQALSLLKGKKKKYSFILFYDKDIYLAKQLEALGYSVFNSSYTISNCDDKAFTYLCMQKNKVPTPETVVLPYMMGEDISTRYYSLLNIIKPLGFPFVLKERVGSFGNQVYLIENEEQFKLILHTCGTKPLLAQKYIPSAHGKDTRVFVVGNKVVAAVDRINENDFRSNVNQGGKMVPHKGHLGKMKKIAIQASKCVKADFCGVDIIKDGKNFYVLEINSNARTTSMKEVLKKDPTKKIVQYIKKHIKRSVKGEE